MMREHPVHTRLEGEEWKPREGAMNLCLGRCIQSRCTLSLFTDEDASNIQLWGADGLRRTRWTTFFLAGLNLEDADRLVQSLGDVLPRHMWYYGSREDHVHRTVGVHQVLHSCVSVVVGSTGFHQPSVLIEAVETLVSSSLDETCHFDVFPCPFDFIDPGDVQDIVSWVGFAVAYIGDGNRRGSRDGLHRCVFGDPDVLDLCFKQLGGIDMGSLAIEAGRRSCLLEWAPVSPLETVYVQE